MKRLLQITFCFMLIGTGWVIRPLTEPRPVAAQATTTKSNLISLIRQDATDFLTVRAKIRQHRASFDALGFTFVDGDFIGDNAGITAAQFTTAVTNLTAIADGFDLGGTLAVGIPTNINRIARLGN